MNSYVLHSCFPKIDSQLLLPTCILAFPRLIAYLPTLSTYNNRFNKFNGLAFTRSISNFPTFLHASLQLPTPTFSLDSYISLRSFFTFTTPRQLSPWIPTCLIAITNLYNSYTHSQLGPQLPYLGYFLYF